MNAPNLYQLDPSAQRIFAAVVDAMQSAEELGGPEGAAYVDLMFAIAAEAQARAATFAKRQIDDVERSEALVDRVRGALGTGETGDDLVAVARAAHTAEQQHATLVRALQEANAELYGSSLGTEISRILAECVEAQ